MLRQVKPKTAAGNRAQKKKLPTALEGAKTAIFMRGSTTSSIVTDALKDLCSIKKPDCVMFSKRNDIHPFDDYKPLEFLSQKNDASFIVLGNHSKKRPHNLVIARMFDYQILDMIELSITDIDFMDEFPNAKFGVGNRPLMLFNGQSWNIYDELKTAKSIFLDLFTGDSSAEYVNLRGISHVISLTAVSTNDSHKIIFKTFAITLKKSGVKIPRVELQEMGPNFDFTVGRVMHANPDMLKEALKIPKELAKKKEKNVEINEFNEKAGRVWVDSQDLGKLQSRKMKGLKRKSKEEENSGSEEEEE